MRHVIAALVRLFLIFGGASFVNPLINKDADLSSVWADIPPAHVALEGDLHVQIYGANGRNLRVRIARDDDEDRTQLATMPLTLDLENRMTIPCGYLSRGGIYYLEVIADVIRDSFKDYDINNDSYEITNDFDGKVLIGENSVDSLSVKLNKRQISEDVSANINNSDTKLVIDKISDKNNLVVNSNQSFKIINSNDSTKYKTVDISKLHEVKKRQIESQKATVMETGDTIVKSWKFEVLWPTASLDVTPEKIQTYPETQVTAIIEFSKVVCTPIESSADFWLELLYCGHSSGGAILCDGKNTSSHAHVLYSEQMHGFPGRRTVTLRCELFGQAGDYYLTLRPAAASGPRDLASAFIKADWSEQFVLNVHGGSVFPCGEGVRTLFQYPECALEGADRVRVFGREADKLRYVAERRVRRGQHTATFECRLFSERYPEYCFVYVSQAVTGAVADVRMDCLPTSPLSDGGAGGWGEWSPWSACPAPAHCSTRTRSRHRFCDNPPPAYGAKYCEGNAVELAACDCTAPPWPGDSSGIVAEVGPRCRCGCVLHLAPSARLLAGSARACPARSFWLLQAEEGLSVRLRIEAVRLPCMGQSLKIRDGDSLGSQLLASWDNGKHPVLTGDSSIKTDSTGLVEISAGRHVLVELRSSDVSDRCSGGFLAHATQYASSTETVRNASAVWASIDPAWFTHGNSARLAVLALVITAVLAALGLTIHSAHRTRAYHRAADKESLTDSDACSASLELAGATSGSRSTLLSDVVGSGVALRKLLPSGRAKHTRLRESVGISANLEPREDPEEQSDCDSEQVEKMSTTSHTSAVSQATVTPEGGSASSGPAQTSVTPVPLRRTACHRSSGAIVETVTSPPQPSITSETATAEMSTSISSVSEREGDSCSDRDKDSVWERDARSDSRASSSTSAATLTNGWYSPALSGVTSARVRGNSKRSKESCNRKLLKSDLSLTSHPEMEMDYYDYEVNNAGSVPGSYLGMDPAFLVWIPPLDEGDIMNEIDDSTPVYEEILPRELLPDPGSNTESPDDLPSSSTLRRSSDKNDHLMTIKGVIDRSSIIQPLNFSASDLQQSPQLPKRNKKHKNQDKDNIPMRNLNLTKSPTNNINSNNDNIKSDNDNSTLKRINDNVKEKRDRDSMKSDDIDIRFADDSESSSDIKFADDDTPDSNKLHDHFVEA